MSDETGISQSCRIVYISLLSLLSSLLRNGKNKKFEISESFAVEETSSTFTHKFHHYPRIWSRLLKTSQGENGVMMIAIYTLRSETHRLLSFIKNLDTNLFGKMTLQQHCFQQGMEESQTERRQSCAWRSGLEQGYSVIYSARLQSHTITNIAIGYKNNNVIKALITNNNESNFQANPSFFN